MTEEDKEHLRALYAGMAMMGIVSRGINADIVESVALNAFIMADAMMQQLQPQEEGIAKARRKKVG
jgi:hypothetical protein